MSPSIPLTGRADGVIYRPQYIRCGKAECWCVDVDLEEAGHGAYWYACWNDGEKTQSQYIGATFREIERPSGPAARALTTAVGYYRKHWEALTRFIAAPEVPIDNSPTEREFQNLAKLRLNMLFAGSTEGAHRACVLLGIVATCRAISVPVQAYLTWVFERLGTHRESFSLALEALTHAAFKAARG
ncbi:Transposase IS66 [Minicystis rosea]|nr:Transposase IS66 [Minicystis rosea]